MTCLIDREGSEERIRVHPRRKGIEAGNVRKVDVALLFVIIEIEAMLLSFALVELEREGLVEREKGGDARSAATKA